MKILRNTAPFLIGLEHLQGVNDLCIFQLCILELGEEQMQRPTGPEIKLHCFSLPHEQYPCKPGLIFLGTQLYHSPLLLDLSVDSSPRGS